MGHKRKVITYHPSGRKRGDTQLISVEPHLPQVIRDLVAHPAFRTATEDLGKPNSHFRGKPGFAVNDL